ncbi:hypothetical protein U1Q18_050725 [Sarracenia purpurea var. burkii]
MVSISTLFAVIILAFAMQISPAENADEHYNLTIIIPKACNDAGDFDYNDVYFNITIPSNPCSNVTFFDVQNGERILEGDLSRLRAQSPLSTKDNNTINMFEQFLFTLQIFQSDLKKMCPENTSDKLQTIRNDTENWFPRFHATLKNIILFTDQLSFADQLLQFASSDYAGPVYEKFIQDVYKYKCNNTNDRTAGFFKLLNLGRVISNTERKFELYHTLHRVMRDYLTADNSMSKLFALHHSLMTEIVNIPGMYGTRGKELICKMWEAHIGKAADITAAALLNYPQRPAAQKTRNDIHTFCPDLFYLVTFEVTFRAYYDMDFPTLLEKIDQNIDDRQEKIVCYEGIMHALETDGKLSDHFLLPLSQYIKTQWHGHYYDYIDEDWLIRLIRIMSKLPGFTTKCSITNSESSNACD